MLHNYYLFLNSKIKTNCLKSITTKNILHIYTLPQVYYNHVLFALSLLHVFYTF